MNLTQQVNKREKEIKHKQALMQIRAKINRSQQNHRTEMRQIYKVSGFLINNSLKKKKKKKSKKEVEALDEGKNRRRVRQIVF